MNDKTISTVSSVVRAILMTAGSAATTSGLVTTDEVTTITGGIVGLIGLVWTAWTIYQRQVNKPKA